MAGERRFSYFSAPPDEARRTVCERRLLDRYGFLGSGSIGRSLLGRRLGFLRIGSGPHAILYVGAHHGMEWITTLLLYRFTEEYCRMLTLRGKDAEGEERSLYILPMLNPDGVEIQLHGAEAGGPLRGRLMRQNGGSGDFRHWQANARGVDLNHNYDAGYEAYREKEREAGITGGCPTRYSGAYAGSEPEVAALCRFLSLLRPALILTLHTQGEEIFYHPTDPPIAGAQETGARLARLSGYRLGSADGMAAYGGMSDYAAERLRLRSYTVECGRGCNPLPIRQGPEIYMRLRRMLFASAGMYR